MMYICSILQKGGDTLVHCSSSMSCSDLDLDSGLMATLGNIKASDDSLAGVEACER